MKSILGTVLFAGLVLAPVPAQGPAPEGVSSVLNEKLKIGGRLDFEFYDAQAERRLGVGGATQFRIRRFQLNLGVEMIRDFFFRSTLTMDPVVRDEDEGAVDLDEAYFRFGNLGRNLFGFEDPTNTFIQVGNFYRWERGFFEARHEAYSLAGTSFYRDEVTGLRIGGDTEEGFFYRLGLDNGPMVTKRDAGVNLNGASPLVHDNEARGDANNSKDFSVGLGIKDRLEEPDVGYRLAVSARFGRLSAADRTFLTNNFGSTYDGTAKRNRYGILAGLDWNDQTFHAGLDAEYWYAKDGNGERQIFGISPFLKLKLDGVYYQQRLFFTGIGLAYRLGIMQQARGFANASASSSTALRAISDDRQMHTLTLGIDVTQNVDMKIEVNTFEENNLDLANTEWLVQWSVRF